MRLLDWLSTRVVSFGREMSDAGSAAVYVRHLLRGNRIPVAPYDGARPAPEPGQPPVLLLHGYLATRGSLHLLEQRLSERGHLVFTYRIGPVNIGGIRQSAGLIARKVEALVTQTPVKKVNIVGHSMGGLVGLYFVKCLGGRDRVHKLILLGSPLGGTWSAVLGLVTAPLGRASVELLPSSPVLRELRERPMPPGVDVVTIAGARDFFAPVESSHLPGARQVTVDASHSGLLVDGGVADTIDDILRAPAPKPSAP
jgi:pimeloyl-ACP methyl ester carboxylesterase